MSDKKNNGDAITGDAITQGEKLEMERLQAAGNVGDFNEKDQALQTTVGKDYDIQKVDFVRIIQDSLSNGNIEIIREFLGQNPEEVKRIIISELENDGYDLDDIQNTLKSFGISASDSEINAPDDEIDVDEEIPLETQRLNIAQLVIDVLDEILNGEEIEQEESQQVGDDEIGQEDKGMVGALFGAVAGGIENAVDKIQKKSKKNDIGLPVAEQSDGNFIATNKIADGHNTGRSGQEI